MSDRKLRAETREQKRQKRTKMKVSGKSVFVIKKTIIKKAKNAAIDRKS